MNKQKIYIGLSIVFIASIGTAVLLPVSEFISGMITLPGIGALFGALFQIARDAVAFENQKNLQTDQQVFSLGATSHMSSVAFDKHVEFCEEYMTEVHKTVVILFQEGPTKTAMDCANKLFEIKRKFAAWIPKSVALKLEPFEKALNEIGSKTKLVESLQQTDKDEIRIMAIEESYEVFSKVMGIEKLDVDAPDHKEELAVENVKERIRAILGINDLFEIRNFIIHRSVEFTRRLS